MESRFFCHAMEAAATRPHSLGSPPSVKWSLSASLIAGSLSSMGAVRCHDVMLLLRLVSHGFAACLPAVSAWGFVLLSERLSKVVIRPSFRRTSGRMPLCFPVTPISEFCVAGIRNGAIA